MQFSLQNFMDGKALMKSLYCFFFFFFSSGCVFLIHTSELWEITPETYLAFEVTTAQLCYLAYKVVQVSIYAGKSYWNFSGNL